MSEPRFPGSPPAVAAGCKCSPTLNRDGIGSHSDEFGFAAYDIDAKCELHGFVGWAAK